MIDRQLIHECCRETLLNIVMDSKKLRENLSFSEHVDLCDYVIEMNYKDTVEVIFELGVRDFEGKFTKALKYGIAGAAGGILAPVTGPKRIIGVGIGMMIAYLFRKATDPCEQSCFKQEKSVKLVCKALCKVSGCNSLLADISKARGKCGATRNPERCQAGLDKAELKWQDKLQDAKMKLDKSKARYAISRAKDINKAKKEGIKNAR